ncbi:META domain-containing protein [Sporichthya sp.]|uniref:META domain-containing protein n=1 Tax=Sporichthya sp. TaxID=65475 RepID=UPI0017FAE031|nr:META domain-containing protein [Sporichthya sp.]MBA3742975.1 META domain-containing protein [Sporichthya sp.]
MRALMVPAATLLMVGLIGCGDDTAEQAGDPAAGGNGAGVGSSKTPTGNFLSTEVTEGGKPTKLVKGTLISLLFRDGQISANAGCNTMGGTAAFTDGKLVVDSLSMTDMGCPGDGRHEQDQFVAEFLTAKPAFTYDGTTLKLNTPEVTMAFGPREQVQPDLPLEGTRWDVTHVTQGPAKGAPDDPNAAVSAGMAPQNAYLELADGKVSGSDGCNRFNGTATIAGDTITFGPIASTKMACPAAAGQNPLSVLTGEVEWSIDYNVLHLDNASGAGLQLQAKTEPTGAADGASDGAAVTPPCCKTTPDGTEPAVAEDLPLNVPDKGTPASDSVGAEPGPDY